MLDRRFKGAFVRAGGLTQPTRPGVAYRMPAGRDAQIRRTRKVIVRRWRELAEARGETPTVPSGW